MGTDEAAAAEQALDALARDIHNIIDDLPSRDAAMARAKTIAAYRRAHAALRELIALRHVLSMQLVKVAGTGK